MLSYLFQQHSSSIVNSALRARTYLESHVRNMTDVYDLAITAYALAKAGSAESFYAYSLLDQRATTTTGKDDHITYTVFFVKITTSYTRVTIL